MKHVQPSSRQPLDTQPSMVKALTFKGDKKAKKRKRAASPSADDPDATALTTTTSTTAHDADADDSWVSADTPADLAGPIILILPTTPPSCLACDAHGKTFASAIENLVDGDTRTAEPHDVRQVWVANRVAGTETLTLKGHHGRFLGCDRFGVVAALSEAISPEQSFTCVPVPGNAGGLALQTAREKFVAVDDADKELSRVAIRGDEEGVGFTATLRVRMQARFKPRLKVAKEERAREKISRKELEEMVGRRLDDEQVKMLKKARREGDFHEALLDVKVKGKQYVFVWVFVMWS